MEYLIIAMWIISNVSLYFGTGGELLYVIINNAVWMFSIGMVLFVKDIYKK